MHIHANQSKSNTPRSQKRKGAKARSTKRSTKVSFRLTLRVYAYVLLLCVLERTCLGILIFSSCVICFVGFCSNKHTHFTQVTQKKQRQLQRQCQVFGTDNQTIPTSAHGFTKTSTMDTISMFSHTQHAQAYAPTRNNNNNNNNTHTHTQPYWT